LAQNVYECLFIFDSNGYARDPNGVSGKVPKMVEDCGGEVLASRLWTEQRLAYPIRGHRKGTYWLTYFRMDSSRVVDFNRACQLNNSILRHLTLKVDPRLVDALVAHTRGEAVPSAESSEPAAAAVQPAGDAGAAEPVAETASSESQSE
jgi:small subunit ribosomal protein S6